MVLGWTAGALPRGRCGRLVVRGGPAGPPMSGQLQQGEAAAAWAGEGSISRLVQHCWPSASPFGVGLSARTV